MPTNTIRTFHDDSDDPLAIYKQLLTGRFEGDEALAAGQQMLRIVTEAIPQAVWCKDLDCRFIWVNPALAKLAGTSPEEMVGKTDRDMPWSASSTFGADWYQDIDREVMATGVPRYGIKEELHMADGSRVWAETNKVPLRDSDGDIIGVLGTFQDVTKRHEADEARQAAIEGLDIRVRERTGDLRRANEALRGLVENRLRLEQRERRQREYAEALRDTAAAVARSLDLEEVLAEVRNGAERLTSPDLVAITLVDEAGTHRLALVHGTLEVPPAAEWRVGRAVESQPLVEEVSRGGFPVARSEGLVGAFGTGTRAALGVPITVSDTLVGCLVVESLDADAFGPAETERLAAVSDVAGSAISNAQRFSAATELAALEERQRLARELHDAVSQTLWTASLVADSFVVEDQVDVTRSDVERIQTLTRGALAEMRTLLLELRPASLVETPLAELLRQLVMALRSHRAIEAEVLAPDALLWEPAAPAKHALYRIAQESLNNVGRHAKASRVTVSLEVDQDELVMLVEDDGCGFDPDASTGDHLGLEIMAERAEALGADFDVRSTPGLGCRTRVALPRDRAVAVG